ncbi:zinc-ribbon domain containing protein [Patescibacteria group bacterium]
MSEKVIGTKPCSKCGDEFTITNQDRTFYAKLDVPDPTHCPVCRNKRRMMWRNDRTFYKRKCDMTGKSMISIYPKDAPFPVYHPEQWYSDKWDPMDYGQDFDFDRPFFEQFKELLLKVPHLGIDIVNCENSFYCNYCGDDKNCYLDIAGEGNEDCYFNLFTKFSKDTADCTFVYNCELCYESINCYNCHNVRYSMYLDNCNDCAFCYDMKGCSDCLFSYNLRHKKYHIFNQEYSKEDYEKKLAELQFGSFQALQVEIKMWQDMMKQAIHRDMYNLNSENCTGNNIKNSKNCHDAYNVVNCEDSKFLYDVLDAKDCYDMNYSLYKPEVAYDIISTLSMRFSAFCMASHYCNNSFYCDTCNNSSNLFGCTALNQKKYCILNKQYTKEEYEKMVEKIKEHMKKTGEWGEFFPVEISPYGYNETVANEYCPLTKEEAGKKGYPWKNLEMAGYKLQKYEIPDYIDDVSDGITDEVLACSSCMKNFKIITQELGFYRKMKLPISRKCPDCRHRDRMERRHPRNLWMRQCVRCNKEIQTPYTPKRSEKIYCEECYLKTVY